MGILILKRVEGQKFTEFVLERVQHNKQHGPHLLLRCKYSGYVLQFTRDELIEVEAFASNVLNPRRR